MSDLVFLNGKFVESEQATISVLDRGVAYGDGLFEMVRVSQGKPFAWKEHWARFQLGLDVLKLVSPLDEAQTFSAVCELLVRNRLEQGFVRWSITRGTGPRGYSIRGCLSPTFFIHCGGLPLLPIDRPLSWTLATVSWQLPPASCLSPCKHSNKLLQILAKAQAQEAGADEPVMTGLDGTVAEAASGNIAWIRGRRLIRPPQSLGSLAGVTEKILEDLLPPLGMELSHESIRPSDLFDTDGVMLNLSTYGVVEAIALDGKTLPQSPLTFQLWSAFERLMQS